MSYYSRNIFVEYRVQLVHVCGWIRLSPPLDLCSTFHNPLLALRYEYQFYRVVVQKSAFDISSRQQVHMYRVFVGQKNRHMGRDVQVEHFFSPSDVMLPAIDTTFPLSGTISSATYRQFQKE